MVEPLFCFREGHLARGDFLENFGARAPDAIRVRELLEQTTAQRIQNALFVGGRISLCVQAYLTLCNAQRIYIRPPSAGLLQISSFQCSNNALADLFQIVAELHFCLLLCDT